jgi:hypothetical protein
VARKKQPRAAALDFVGDYMPIDAAFMYIRDRIGSAALAARDLHAALLDGRLRSAYRRIKPDGTQDQGELSPDFWKQFTLTESYDGKRVAFWSNKVVTADYYFFVHRADLDRLYPTERHAEPAHYQHIRAMADLAFPNGWQDLRQVVVVYGVAEQFKKRGEKVPERQMLLRALGYRQR